MSQPTQRNLVQFIGLVLGPLLAIPLFLFFDPDPGRPLIGEVAGVAWLMAVWWVTEAVPLAATAVLPMVLFPLLGVTSPSDTAGAFMNSVIFLYVGGSLIALAMERWNLHRRIALSITYRVGRRPDRVILGFLVATAFMSMWISNVATAVMMLPIGLAVIKKLEETHGVERTRGLALAILIGIAYASSIGGVATLIGTPTNLSFVKIFAETFPAAPEVSFGQWFLLGFPTAVLMLAATWFVLTRVVFRSSRGLTVDREIVGSELRALGRSSYEERVVIVVGSITALLWVFRGDLVLGSWVLPGWGRLWEGFRMVDDSTVAVAAALLLFVIPAKSGRGKAILDGSAFRDLPWSAILLFGGGFALAGGFAASGLTSYLATEFSGFTEVPVWLTVLLGCLGVAVLTEFVSNIACVQMFLPVLASLAIARGIHPMLIMVPATMTSSLAFLMPVGSPPNAVIFGSDRVRIADMVRAGIVVKIVTLVITLGMCALLLSLVYGVEAGALPDWARG